ncbi:MAG: response regulator transcription factor [Sphingomonadales bacterium]|nr:response regulator transcription factor [Sphingomonadales bacterium]
MLTSPLILLDLQLPDSDGIRVLGELRELYPAISVVMLSAFNDRDNVIRALDNGALGFIPKTDSREVLLGALRLILAGGTYIPPEILASGPTATAALLGKPADNKTSITGRARPYRATGRRAGTHDAGQKQQADLPRARFGRADGKEPCVGDPQGPWRDEPYRAVLAVAALGWELQTPVR